MPKGTLNDANVHLFIGQAGGKRVTAAVIGRIKSGHWRAELGSRG